MQHLRTCNPSNFHSGQNLPTSQYSIWFCLGGKALQGLPSVYTGFSSCWQASDCQAQPHPEARESTAINRLKCCFWSKVPGVSTSIYFNGSCCLAHRFMHCPPWFEAPLFLFPFFQIEIQHTPFGSKNSTTFPFASWAKFSTYRIVLLLSKVRSFNPTPRS